MSSDVMSWLDLILTGEASSRLPLVMFRGMLGDVVLAITLLSGGSLDRIRPDSDRMSVG